MSRFAITDLPLNGLKLVERQLLGDSRGFLARLFCAEELGAAGWHKPIAQINHTFTARRGTVRGMHFQRPPESEMKLVSCIRGKVWDVAVDGQARKPFCTGMPKSFRPTIGMRCLFPRVSHMGFRH